jgi:dTDP-4-dehydrorhamnose reductase|tara:strand:+ start:820 stop:1686 length:867 start_codon:yes stop_codon:yes gene_type:complete
LFQNAGIKPLGISSFHSHIIGADRPVGKHLTRLLAEQNLIYRGVSIESTERPHLQSSARPVYILTPSLLNPRDIEASRFWLQRAKDEDALVIFVSTLAVYKARSGETNETITPDQDNELAHCFTELEALAQQNPQHIILRVGQLFSLESEDFAGKVLNHIRTTPDLALDMQKLFQPTPVDDVASVIVAILRQVNCSDNLWGTYHFTGVEATSSYGFAEALLSEASQYEDLSSACLTTQEGGMMPDVWTPVSDQTHLFYTFGIKKKPWRQGLARLIKSYYRADKTEAEA